MIIQTLNNDTGIATTLRLLDTRFQKNRNVCGNRILRTWRECKTKTILWIERRFPVKRLKRHEEFLGTFDRSPQPCAVGSSPKIKNVIKNDPKQEFSRYEEFFKPESSDIKNIKY